MQANAKRNPKLPAQLTLDTVSPATRLLEKRRQMFEVQEALDAQKEEFERRDTIFKRREEILKNKDRELQESLIKFNKFLQDNDSKRNRAEKKERDEVKLRQVKETEITRLSTQLGEQQAQHARMVQELSKMLKYSHYLEDVLQHEAEFVEIADIISRYDTLTAAHDDLVSRSHEADAKQELFRAQLQTFVREKSDEALGQNNKIAELQKATEVAIADSLSAALTADREASALAGRKLQLGQVVMACENIYLRCCDRSTVQRKTRQLPADADEEAVLGDMLEKLDFIQDYALDLTDIALRGFRAPDLAKKPLAQPAPGSPQGKIKPQPSPGSAGLLVGPGAGAGSPLGQIPGLSVRSGSKSASVAPVRGGASGMLSVKPSVTSSPSAHASRMDR